MSDSDNVGNDQRYKIVGVVEQYEERTIAHKRVQDPYQAEF